MRLDPFLPALGILVNQMPDYHIGDECIIVSASGLRERVSCEYVDQQLDKQRWLPERRILTTLFLA